MVTPEVNRNADLGQATERLEAAVARLRGTLAKTGKSKARELKGSARERDALADDLDKLRLEHEKLLARLATIEEENKALRQTADKVSRRIESVAGELAQVIGA